MAVRARALGARHDWLLCRKKPEFAAWRRLAPNERSSPDDAGRERALYPRPFSRARLLLLRERQVCQSPEDVPWRPRVHVTQIPQIRLGRASCGQQQQQERKRGGWPAATPRSSHCRAHSRTNAVQAPATRRHPQPPHAPVSTRQLATPALFAKRQSVSSLSPTITASAGLRPCLCSSRSMITREGFPTTTASLCAAVCARGRGPGEG